MSEKKKCLNEITEFAKLQFEPKDIAIILDLNVQEFESLCLGKDNSDEKTAYQKGLLLADAELRKSIYTMSKQGSSPAQKEFLSIIKKRIINNEKTARKL